MKNLKLYFSKILILLFISSILISCYSTSNSKPQKNISSVSIPNTIIYHKNGKDIVIEKGAEFNEIVQVINMRLNGLKIGGMGSLVDVNLAPALSCIDSIEFRYVKMNTSFFVNKGSPHSPIRSSGNISLAPVKIIYNKLIFPLADSHGFRYNIFSNSMYSYGDPIEKINENGKDGAVVIVIHPIDTPEKLIEILKTRTIS
jgi:hypothetical protein